MRKAGNRFSSPAGNAPTGIFPSATATDISTCAWLTARSAATWKKSAGSFTGYQITLLDQKGKALSRTNVSRKTNVKRVVSPVDPASCKVEVRTFEKKAGKRKLKSYMDKIHGYVQQDGGKLTGRKLELYMLEAAKLLQVS